MTLPHHSLVVWQRADDVFIELHKLTVKTFPALERFELGSQTRRAAYSVAANVVEGAARVHKAEKLQFFNTSRWSLAEVAYCLHVANRLACIDDDRFSESDVSVRRVGAALNGYIRAVKDGRSI